MTCFLIKITLSYFRSIHTQKITSKIIVTTYFPCFSLVYLKCKMLELLLCSFIDLCSIYKWDSFSLKVELAQGSFESGVFCAFSPCFLSFEDCCRQTCSIFYVWFGNTWELVPKHLESSCHKLPSGCKYSSKPQNEIIQLVSRRSQVSVSAHHASSDAAVLLVTPFFSGFVWVQFLHLIANLNDC